MLLKLSAVLFITLSLFGQVDQSEAQLIGNCEGCEAVFEYGDRELTPTDTLPDFHNQGEKLKVTGIIYLSDGKTPAENTTLYVYHTNQEGIYEAKENSTGWEKRHGYIRGWMKTGKDGKYTFYTLIPGAYPTGSEPKHIHPIILEPNGKYYWLPSYFFKGDSLLGKNISSSGEPRGGWGNILNPTKQNGLWVAEKDIILGRNVPGYDE